MADKQMDLLLRIRARGQEALNELRKVRGVVGGIGKAAVGMGRMGALGFRHMLNATKMLLAPLKIAAATGLILGTMFVGLAGKALAAEGGLESLRLRMEGVTASAEDANRIFQETMRMSVFSPFEPTELINARIQLLNIGQEGPEALRAVGDASSITQKELVDLASMVASLETEPLRRIGVELKREAGKFEFEFRDKMGKVRNITAQGITEARGQLLSIFDIKYGGGMARFASAWRGLLSTLRGNVDLALGQFGEGLMPPAKRFISFLNEKLSELTEAGTFRDFGRKAADAIVGAFDYARSVLEVGRDVFKEVRETGPEALKDAFGIVFSAGAQVLVTSLVAYLKASSSIFLGIGQLIAGAILKDLLASDLPGMGKVRKAMGLRIDTQGERSLAGFIEYSKARDKAKSEWKTLSREEQVRRALGGGVDQRLFERGLYNITEKGPEIAAQAQKTMADAFAKANAELKQSTGIDVDRRIALRRVDIAAGRVLSDMDQPEDPAMAMFGPRKQRRGLLAGRGRGGEQLVRRTSHDVETGALIHIENLVIKADNARQLSNQLAKRAGQAALAVAGT